MGIVFNYDDGWSKALIVYSAPHVVIMEVYVDLLACEWHRRGVILS